MISKCKVYNPKYLHNGEPKQHVALQDGCWWSPALLRPFKVPGFGHLVSSSTVWGDDPALFDMLVFIFKIYIYALEVLQCQGAVETPRVLFGAAVIVDLSLGMPKRG